MKRILIGILSALILLSAGFCFFLYPKLEIISGYNAKIMCSCLFVSEMNRPEIEAIDLGFGPLWLADNQVDRSEKTVESSVWGFHPKLAVYREGLGCTLVHTADTASVRSMTLDTSQVNYAPEMWPDYDVEPLGRLREAIEAGFDPPGTQLLNTRAILVVKGGEIIGERYAEGFDRHSKLPGWSMMKSVNSAIAGLLVKDGVLTLDAPAPIDAWENDGRSGITLRHLLNMTSGLDWNEDYTTVSTATEMLYGTDDMGAYAATVPSKHPPGETWYYSSGTSNIISRITADAFRDKDQYRMYAYKRLFGPAGMRNFIVETDASGTFVGSSYGYGSARDWAKFALLYARKGNLNGTQILDTAWTEFSVTPVPASGGKYGAQFWLNADERFEHYGKDSYWLGGFQGKQVSVHPEDDLIIVRIGVTYDTDNIEFDNLIKNIREAAAHVKIFPENSAQINLGSTSDTSEN